MDKDKLVRVCYDWQTNNAQYDGWAKKLEKELNKIGQGHIWQKPTENRRSRACKEIKYRCNDTESQNSFRKFNREKPLLFYWNMKLLWATRTSETSVDNYFTRQYIPEDKSELHTHRRENSKSHTLLLWFFFFVIFRGFYFNTIIYVLILRQLRLDHTLTPTSRSIQTWTSERLPNCGFQQGFTKGFFASSNRTHSLIVSRNHKIVTVQDVGL
jgi:hypothetical protein